MAPPGEIHRTDFAYTALPFPCRDPTQVHRCCVLVSWLVNARAYVRVGRPARAKGEGRRRCRQGAEGAAPADALRGVPPLPQPQPEEGVQRLACSVMQRTMAHCTACMSNRMHYRIMRAGRNGVCLQACLNPRQGMSSAGVEQQLAAHQPAIPPAPAASDPGPAAQSPDGPHSADNGMLEVGSMSSAHGVPSVALC
jgi:hypothetical protein